MVRRRYAFAAAALLAALSGNASAQSAGGAEARIQEKGITIAAASPGRATNRVGTVQVGNLLFVGGHPSGPQWTLKGKVGRELTIEQGQQAARQSGLNLLSTVRGVLGSLDRVKRVVKVTGMVNAPDGFGDTPKVIDGFSDLMIEVFGEAGKHARTAVGVSALPGNDPVEVEAIFEVE